MALRLQKRLMRLLWLGVPLAMLVLGCRVNDFAAQARNMATPWSNENTVQNLVYGASSTADVVRIMGQPPDDVVRSQQSFPVVENYYYYDGDKSGAATVFVFENGLLAGFQLKTAGDQFVDMTYLLPNNGDRLLNQPMLQGYLPYYPYFPIPTW